MLSASAQFRTHPAPRRRYDLPGVACLVSSADRCSVSSVWAAVCPGTCLPWFWHGLPCCLCCAVCPDALGLGSPPAGYTGSSGGGVGHARDKIFQRKRRFSWFVLLTPTSSSQTKPHLIVQVSKNSEKNKKTPYGAIECVILAKERWN